MTKRYLRITESRFKGEDQEREQRSIIVFPQDVTAFVEAVVVMTAKFSKTETAPAKNGTTADKTPGAKDDKRKKAK